MSEFSTELKRVFDENGIKIYPFAEGTGLDRTTLQRMNSGKKLPSRQFVKTVLDHLPISTSEREYLEYLFYIEKIGLKAYHRRCAVKDMMENFCELSKSMTESSYRRKIDFSIEPSEERKWITPILMEVDMIDTLRYMVIDAFNSMKEVHIYLNNFNHSFYIMQQLIQENSKSNKKVFCHQLVNLQRNIHSNLGDGGIRNVEVLKNAIPFLVAFKGEYDLRYSYGSVDENYLGSMIWPNYVISQSKVLLISSDEKSGLLIEDEEIASSYRKEVCRIQKDCKPLFSFVGRDNEVVSYLLRELSQKKFTYAFSQSVSIPELVYNEMVKRDFDGVEIIRSYLGSYNHVKTKNSEKLMTIHGMYGMKKFTQTGLLPGFYENYVGAYSKEARIRMIHDYANYIRESGNTYLLKEEPSSEETLIEFNLFDQNGVYICISHDQEYIACVYVEESETYDILVDYLHSLIDEEKVYSKEESANKFIEKCMNYMENQGG
ncbi:hypothetical protein P261_01823 [Lachnospiraceae bacterium TWA4]|nr:hypothetical protein P261_01823 [Lachnospiraceae bacterium TWA4]